MASGGGGGGGWLKFILKFCGAEWLNPWSIMPAQLFDGGTSQPRRRTSPLPLPLRPLPPPPKVLGNPGKGSCLRRSLQCYPLFVIKVQSVNCDWHRNQTHKDLLLKKNKNIILWMQKSHWKKKVTLMTGFNFKFCIYEEYVINFKLVFSLISIIYTFYQINC